MNPRVGTLKKVPVAMITWFIKFSTSGIKFVAIHSQPTWKGVQFSCLCEWEITLCSEFDFHADLSLMLVFDVEKGRNFSQSRSMGRGVSSVGTEV